MAPLRLNSSEIYGHHDCPRDWRLLFLCYYHLRDCLGPWENHCHFGYRSPPIVAEAQGSGVVIRPFLE